MQRAQQPRVGRGQERREHALHELRERERRLERADPGVDRVAALERREHLCGWCPGGTNNIKRVSDWQGEERRGDGGKDEARRTAVGERELEAGLEHFYGRRGAGPGGEIVSSVNG